MDYTCTYLEIIVFVVTNHRDGALAGESQVSSNHPQCASMVVFLLFSPVFSTLDGRPNKRPRCGHSLVTNDGNAFIQCLVNLRRDNVGCDVTLIAGEDDTRINAHRVVMAARSPWFESMLRRWEHDKHEGEIHISEVSKSRPCGRMASSIRVRYSQSLATSTGISLVSLKGEPSRTSSRCGLLLHRQDRWCQWGKRCCYATRQPATAG